MTYIQSQAIWELCRQGFPLAAYEAEAHWENGKVYRPDSNCKLSRESERFIERCNRETQVLSEALAANASQGSRQDLRR